MVSLGCCICDPNAAESRRSLQLAVHQQDTDAYQDKRKGTGHFLACMQVQESDTCAIAALRPCDAAIVPTLASSSILLLLVRSTSEVPEILLGSSSAGTPCSTWVVNVHAGLQQMTIFSTSSAVCNDVCDCVLCAPVLLCARHTPAADC